MNLSLTTYLDKLRACFLGKNIGGTLGAPFESRQGAVDLDYYTHDLTQGVLPNDDLDLQLVFLNAAEKFGVGVNSEILGNYWTSFIVPDWSEYGIGKRNMRAGLLPPLSGRYHNPYGESNGCWIRSEIWAALAPGHPEIAVRYAWEDGSIDHFGDGIYAEMFTAAIESAAFVESDMEKLIDIALTYIPQDCKVAQAVAYIRACAKEQQTDWKAARKKFLMKFPSSFGLYPADGQEMDPDVPLTDHRCDAPTGIGLMLLGHYYGQGDFSRALCIAAGCCDDADCTAGTLGALYGILYGTSGIDQKWVDPIGDEIKTLSVDRSKAGIPQTVTELIQRVARLMPSFVSRYIDIAPDGTLSIQADPAGMNAPRRPTAFGAYSGSEALRTQSSAPYWTGCPADCYALKRATATVEFFMQTQTLDIREGEPWTFTLRADPFPIPFADHADWYTVVLHVPTEWEVPQGRTMALETAQSYIERTEHTFTVIPHDLKEATYHIVVELRQNAGPGRAYFPYTLFHTC